MNIELIKTIATRKAGKTIFALQKYSPEILLGLGLASGLATVVLAVVGSKKADDILEDHNTQMEVSNLSGADNRKKMEIYTRTGLKLCVVYGPAVATGATSVLSILASHNIIRGRNLALMAAYKALDVAFGSYRERVVDKLGAEVEKNIYLALEDDVVEVVVEDPDTGKKKKAKKVVGKVQTSEGVSVYAKIFDEYNVNWERNAEMNLYFLRNQQRFANERLKAVGHVFLNEVYESLGFPKTSAGAVVGWLDKGNGDGYIDFGLYDLNGNVSKADFINGHNRSVMLDFNVDGIMYDKI